jgi:2-phosphoglycerate kinase
LNDSPDKTAVEEPLLLERLAEGHRPSIVMLGMVGAQALKAYGTAVLMTDLLGRVYLMPSDSVRVLTRPRVSEEDLDALEESDAIRVLCDQGDSEDAILEYLKRRASRTSGR